MQVEAILQIPSLPRSRSVSRHVSPRNAPSPQTAAHMRTTVLSHCLWGGALRDETKNGCEGDYQIPTLISRIDGKSKIKHTSYRVLSPILSKFKLYFYVNYSINQKLITFYAEFVASSTRAAKLNGKVIENRSENYCQDFHTLRYVIYPFTVTVKILAR